MDDGALVCAAEEERFSRRKHDASFPALAIDFCLRTAAESGRPIDYVAFYEQPSTKFRRVLTTAAAMGKPAEDAFVRSMRAWRTERRGIRAAAERTRAASRGSVSSSPTTTSRTPPAPSSPRPSNRPP